MKAVLILPDGSDYCHQGKLDFVSFQISPTTDSVLVRAVFPNKKEKGAGFDLIPGQYAPVRLILGEQPDALLIPQPALMESQAGQQVFVVNQENKVESRMVDVGSSYKHQWVIKKGLKKGEKVIVEGVQKVRPGMVVKPETAASQKDWLSCSLILLKDMGWSARTGKNSPDAVPAHCGFSVPLRSSVDRGLVCSPWFFWLADVRSDRIL